MLNLWKFIITLFGYSAEQYQTNNDIIEEEIQEENKENNNYLNDFTDEKELNKYFENDFTYS